MGRRPPRDDRRPAADVAPRRSRTPGRRRGCGPPVATTAPTSTSSSSRADVRLARTAGTVGRRPGGAHPDARPARQRDHGDRRRRRPRHAAALRRARHDEASDRRHVRPCRARLRPDGGRRGHRAGARRRRHAARRDTDDLWSRAERDEPFDDAARLELRLRMVTACRLSGRAVDLFVEAAGIRGCASGRRWSVGVGTPTLRAGTCSSAPAVWRSPGACCSGSIRVPRDLITVDLRLDRLHG